MTANKRTPKLTIDEVILLVDTYFSLKQIDDSAMRREMIGELSSSMRALPFFPEELDNPAFRSVDGMHMCLSNVASIDPDAQSKFGHGSLAQTFIFDYYQDKKEQLHNLARAIKAVSSLDFPLLPQYQSSIVGQLLPSYHEYLEHSDKTVKNAYKMVHNTGRTKCSVCGNDLAEKYNQYALDLMEAHISLPIEKYDGRQRIVSSDILMLCPTCHKLAHHNAAFLCEEHLRGIVKG